MFEPKRRQWLDQEMPLSLEVARQVRRHLSDLLRRGCLCRRVCQQWSWWGMVGPLLGTTGWKELQAGTVNARAAVL